MPTPQSLDELRASFRRNQEAIRRDPVGWCERALGTCHYSKQCEIIEAPFRYKYTVVPSSNASGKTYAIAETAIAWLMTHYPAKVVITSSSWANIQNEIWPEIHKVIHNAPFEELHYPHLPRPFTTKWIWTWGHGIYSVSPKHPENLGGYHAAGGVLIIVDEASALETIHEQAIDGCMASGKASIMLLGNPLCSSGTFYEACRKADAGKLWHKISISAFDSPNITGAEPPIPGLATCEWITDMQEKYPKDSPAYQARVLGIFPTSETNQLIPLLWIERATQRAANPHACGGYRALGVDVGRSLDGDPSVIYLVRGNEAVLLDEVWFDDTTVIADLIQRRMQEHGVPPERVRIDDIGVGGGVTDVLRTIRRLPVVGVATGRPARDPVTFGNIRAEEGWRLREWIETIGRIPDDENLKADLCAPRLLAPNQQGRQYLEPKEITKTRTNRGLHHFDALGLAIYEPPNLTIEITWGQPDTAEYDEAELLRAVSGRVGWM